MIWITKNLWLIPALPLLAAGLIAVVKRRHRTFGACAAIVSMEIAFFLACAAFVTTLGHAEMFRETCKFSWLQLGDSTLELGWVLDPLTAVMLVMVTLVGTLIFIYSTGYMANDENLTRFFCFLALFAAAMLGVVIANNLLLLFICWELVGFTSYMLIGFWYDKPSAAAAAKKAFITTRIGDIGFFLGMLWLYSETGTLLFYDGGSGCLEQSALTKLVGQSAALGMAASTGISLLIFCGAIGKSGQVPLHVWLPDAMEGPTPVSALIHAATMVAAGVFLVARVYPLMAAVPTPSAKSTLVKRAEQTLTPALSLSEREREKQNTASVESQRTEPSSVNQPANAAANVHPLPAGEGRGEGGAHDNSSVSDISTALTTVTWVGAITAVFAALIAVAQTDIKRILAYSTVSQLGYMMMGLGVGGVAVGMFHLITHAFFKALLFLGAGSVIHGCHDEQDIRRMGGLQPFMPVTFWTYAVGMMALAGVPVFFAGFWSKDDILHHAAHWPVSTGPFLLGVFGALLTAFYMARQLCYVFFGRARLLTGPDSHIAHDQHHAARDDTRPPVHESSRVMTVPLVILAVFSVLLGFLGTPAWPWFQDYLSGHHAAVQFGQLFRWDTFSIMALSAIVGAIGLGAGLWLYGLQPAKSAEDPDPLEQIRPDLFTILRSKFYVDELYQATVVRFNSWSAWLSDWLDRNIWNGIVKAASFVVLGCSWISRVIDEFAVNRGFDEGCGRIRRSGERTSSWQTGQAQNYLRAIGLALALLVLFLSWGCGK